MASCPSLAHGSPATQDSKQSHTQKVDFPCLWPWPVSSSYGAPSSSISDIVLQYFFSCCLILGAVLVSLAICRHLVFLLTISDSVCTESCNKPLEVIATMQP